MGGGDMETTEEAILERIDTISHELQELRRLVTRSQTRPAGENLAEQLFGILGHGSWDEYDQQLDWQRFA
jgi:predicted dienelactone hydrolase